MEPHFNSRMCCTWRPDALRRLRRGRYRPKHLLEILGELARMATAMAPTWKVCKIRKHLINELPVGTI